MKGRREGKGLRGRKIIGMLEELYNSIQTLKRKKESYGIMKRILSICLSLPVGRTLKSDSEKSSKLYTVEL